MQKLVTSFIGLWENDNSASSLFSYVFFHIYNYLMFLNECVFYLSFFPILYMYVKLVHLKPDLG